MAHTPSTRAAAARRKAANASSTPGTRRSSTTLRGRRSPGFKDPQGAAARRRTAHASRPSHKRHVARAAASSRGNKKGEFDPKTGMFFPGFSGGKKNVKTFATPHGRSNKPHPKGPHHGEPKKKEGEGRGGVSHAGHDHGKAKSLSPLQRALKEGSKTPKGMSKTQHVLQIKKKFDARMALTRATTTGGAKRRTIRTYNARTKKRGTRLESQATADARAKRDRARARVKRGG